MATGHQCVLTRSLRTSFVRNDADKIIEHQAHSKCKINIFSLVSPAPCLVIKYQSLLSVEVKSNFKNYSMS